MSKNIKILSESRAFIQPLDNVADQEAATILNQAVKDIAAVDGDRVLDQAEAEALNRAYLSVLPQGGTIGVTEAKAITSALSIQMEQLNSERTKSTEVLFTSEAKRRKDNFDRFRGAIIGSMENTIEKANGRPVDINLMIFSFTDKVMGDKILELARENPNVNFRLLSNWTELSSRREPGRLASVIAEEGIENIDIKFKKDSPYRWDHAKKRPKYDHMQSTGLNHHKGFVTMIDGRPEKMVFGSFNWSIGAMSKNEENIMLLDRADPDNRSIMNSYQSEFEAFWNNDVSLTYNEARAEKNRIYAELYEANGQSYTPRGPTEADDVDEVYESVNESEYIDVNSLGDADAERIISLVGKTQANKIFKELRDYGRFDTITELYARVPSLAKVDAWEREQLVTNLEFGDGGISINTATVEELDRAGLSRRQAERVVSLREEKGAFESIEELDDIPGIGKGTIARISDTMNADQVLAFFSSKTPETEANIGFSEENHGTLRIVAEGAREPHELGEGPFIPGVRSDMIEVQKDLAAPVKDMLRRAQPGQTFRMAMYSLSTSSPEWQEMKEALSRGVKVRIVVYGKWAKKTINEIKSLKEQGLDIDYRQFKSRVMHEKFGILGDDVFNGSANWSTSSIKKHSEDRFLFRNEPELADRFLENFNRLWVRGKE